jgi:hypothetical protein
MLFFLSIASNHNLKMVVYGKKGAARPRGSFSAAVKSDLFLVLTVQARHYVLIRDEVRAGAKRQRSYKPRLNQVVRASDA